MKQVQAYLSAREDRESSFHRCAGPVHSKNNGMKFIPKGYDLHPSEFHT